MIPFHKHFKEVIDRYRYASEYIDEGVDPWFNNLIVYERLTTNTPASSTNAATDNSIFLTDNSSIEYTNGYSSFGTLDLNSDFSISIFVYSNSDIPLFALDNVFSITYSSGFFNVVRKLSAGIYQTVNLPATIPSNTWTHVLIIRKLNQLNFYINFELVGILEFNYLLESSTAYIGRNYDNTITYTGNFTFLRIYNVAIELKYCNANALLRELIETDIESTYNLKQYLLYEDIVSFSYKQITGDTFYDTSLSAWKVYPNTFTLHGEVLDRTTYPLTIELELETPVTPTSDFILFSSWYLSSFASFYIKYNFLTENIELVTFNSSIETEILVEYVPGKNIYCIQFLEDDLQFYLNGTLVYSKGSKSRLPLSYKYSINPTVNGVVNTSNICYLYWFASYNLQKYTSSYIPVKPLENRVYRKSSLLKLNNHAVEYANANYPTLTNNFDITGTFVLVPGEEQVYTITQQNRQRYDTVYSISFLTDKDSVSNDITFPLTATVLAGELSTTFNITFLEQEVHNPYKNSFQLKIANKQSSVIKDFTVNFTGLDYDRIIITSIDSYITGYLASDTVTPGTIPNLTNTSNASTSATYLTNTIYGKSYYLEDTGDEIILPTTLSDIRTVVMLYQELDTVVNRSYVGDTDEYTFNGGDVDELVGDLILQSSDFTKTFTLTDNIYKTVINQDNTLLVTLDTALNKVRVYTKNGAVWSTSPVELSLDLSDENVLTNATVAITSDGSYIALGLPEGNNAEGVVQIWHNIAGTWTKELHLGSPVPAPYTGGFGYSVDLSDNGLRLFVSQIGSSTVYIFDKSSTWSSTPSETLIGSDRFGYTLSCSSSGDSFVVTEADTTTSYVYRYDSSWSLEETINFGLIALYNKSIEGIALADYFEQEVRIYTESSGWNLIKTLNSLDASYGFSIGYSNNGNLAIGSPDTNKVYFYTASSSYVDERVFTELDGYGYSLSLNDYSLVISNFDDIVDFYTSDASSLPQKIIFVRQNQATATITDSLEKQDINILTFSSNVDLQIDKIGNSRIETGLNGYWLGTLFFSDILDINTIVAIEDFLIKYLGLYKYSLW